MTRPAGHVEVRRVIAADADALYEMVSDVTRMGEWSPETTSCRWVGPVRGPRVGARFIGVNRHGWQRWATLCRVTAAEAGRHFAFESGMGMPIARWSFTFEPTEGGTLVIQSWTDRRNAVVRRSGALVTGVRDRAPHNAEGMALTLERLAAAAEGDAEAEA